MLGQSHAGSQKNYLALFHDLNKVHTALDVDVAVCLATDPVAFIAVQSMYIRVKRKKTTIFLVVEPTDTVLEVKQKLQALIDKVGLCSSGCSDLAWQCLSKPQAAAFCLGMGLAKTEGSSSCEPAWYAQGREQQLPLLVPTSCLSTNSVMPDQPVVSACHHSCVCSLCCVCNASHPLPVPLPHCCCAFAAAPRPTAAVEGGGGSGGCQEAGRLESGE
jgi:hypothetical protein